jgi:uridine phosphorylase
MGKILQRCDLCKNFHVAFVETDLQTGEKLHLCSNCWKKRHTKPEAEGQMQKNLKPKKKGENEPTIDRLFSLPYPILEFDPAPEAMIEPKKENEPRDVPEHCVICFFREVLQKVAEEHKAFVAVENHWEDGSHPLYEISHQGQRLAFFHPGVGGAISASLLEEMIATGCRKFIVCGGCGVLKKGVEVGHLIVVSSAVRDEGVSYHYLPPGREVQANPAGMAALVTVLERDKIPYRLGKTWTTDAPYRETHTKVASRRAEGCVTVEMEAASLMAVAQFRGVVLGQVLYAGDDLSGNEWDDRGWVTRKDIREKLFWLAADACLKL